MHLHLEIEYNVVKCWQTVTSEWWWFCCQRLCTNLGIIWSEVGILQLPYQCGNMCEQLAMPLSKHHVSVILTNSHVLTKTILLCIPVTCQPRHVWQMKGPPTRLTGNRGHHVGSLLRLTPRETLSMESHQEQGYSYIKLQWWSPSPWLHVWRREEWFVTMIID